MNDDVLFAREGAVARIRLNRPRALHALTHDMCRAMIAHLLDWRADAAVELVMIDHAEGRGFCAGGDIRAIAESGAGDGQAARAFFADEYRLNHLLFTYAKPVAAFMDGVVMGGGVGIAQPARFRIATDRTLYAMPESGIGLFPDVGGGWYLSRLPGRVGQWLALTGARLDGADACALGLATHYLPSDRIDAAKAALVDRPRDTAQTLNGLAVPPPPAQIEAIRADIDRLFAKDALDAILDDLAADGSVWAAEQRRIILTRSPLSCTVALKQLADSVVLTDFADEMRIEYRIAARMCQRHDFIEGVRALIVDKDNAPRWDPATADDVTPHMIDTIFSGLPEGEEWEPVRL